MKKKGTKAEYLDQRDKELYAHFLTLLRTAVDVDLRDMFAMAAKMPASRFWVGERYAADVIADMLRNPDGPRFAKMTPGKLEMYRELKSRVQRLMEADPSLCLSHAVEKAVHEPAPRFYLTDESARLIIYRHRRRQKALRNLQKLIK